jgi:hypothetical protein
MWFPCLPASSHCRGRDWSQGWLTQGHQPERVSTVGHLCRQKSMKTTVAPHPSRKSYSPFFVSDAELLKPQYTSQRANTDVCSINWSTKLPGTHLMAQHVLQLCPLYNRHTQTTDTQGRVHTNRTVHSLNHYPAWRTSRQTAAKPYPPCPPGCQWLIRAAESPFSIPQSG